jgi:SNF2 family DNA or RNA helicase
MRSSGSQDMPGHCKSSSRALYYQVIEFVLNSSVVAPLAVMEQWAGEIRTKTLKGHIKVTTHHGPSRTKRKFKFVDKISLISSRKGTREIRCSHHHLPNSRVRARCLRPETKTRIKLLELGR